MKGWVGTDANGYNFGPDMPSATSEGKRVSYVFRNPESGGVGSGNFGDLELKNVWVVCHDGLLFASGWYIDDDEYTRQLVSVAVDEFNSGGLMATVAYFASPGSALAGLESAIDYYNSAETVDGKWAAFIADGNGNIVAHSNPALIGKHIGGFSVRRTFPLRRRAAGLLPSRCGCGFRSPADTRSAPAGTTTSREAEWREGLPNFRTTRESARIDGQLLVKARS